MQEVVPSLSSISTSFTLPSFTKAMLVNCGFFWAYDEVIPAVRIMNTSRLRRRTLIMHCCFHYILHKKKATLCRMAFISINKYNYAFGVEVGSTFFINEN